MPTSGFLVFNIARSGLRVRQNLPRSRQKFPSKQLKNNKNSLPGSVDRAVQGSEAVCELRDRQCGLESRK
ncbi:hypothetical protein ACQR0Z_15460 [Bradyrhizobium sp. HKCCYLS3077]|uniref:hypothetical protein n=1 Tax=Bradyrhizobium sp. HKCCYLS3077 TaxID=3420761 RepID=UPI003EBFF2B7